MISSGYFAVDKEILRGMSNADARKFVGEMYSHGGRIGTDEYLRWMKWLESNGGNVNEN